MRDAIVGAQRPHRSQRCESEARVRQNFPGDPGYFFGVHGFDLRDQFARVEDAAVGEHVRGDFATLELAVLTRGWPRLSEARGKIMFALDNTGGARGIYIAGHPSLQGRVLFTDSPAGTPEAAFMKRNDPLANPGDIESLVKQGYMVRTRADADTVQSRNNDTTQRDAALSSGAQFISTDYPVPNLDFSDYQVTLPGGGIARCNPVSPGNCQADLL